MTTLGTQVSALNELIAKGNTLTAMELFYADDIVMQENEAPPRIGKQLCMEHERNNLAHIKGLTCQLLSQAINNETNRVFSEWEIVFVDNNNHTLKLTEVAVQQWQDGKIIREKFYYKDFYPVP